MLTQILAVELGHANIQVNAIAPGVIKTRFSQVLWQTPQIAEPILGHLPLGRFGGPEDVAGPSLCLASSASDYATGANGQEVDPALGGGAEVPTRGLPVINARKACPSAGQASACSRFADPFSRCSTFLVRFGSGKVALGSRSRLW